VNTLRLTALALQVLLVGAVMLIAGSMAMVITLCLYPPCYVRNKASLLLESLLREMGIPGPWDAMR
jgi:hypothetical protein